MIAIEQKRSEFLEISIRVNSTFMILAVTETFSAVGLILSLD